MITDEQREERRAFIGGSDIGAIIGVNRYRSPLDIYMEKTGRIPATQINNDRIHFGNVLEGVIAEEYARRTGQRVRRRNQTFTHKVLDWARANIDRSVDGENMILEIKTADKWTADQWGDEGTDEVPDSYMAQVVWYMGVLDYDRADLAVLIGGNDFRIYHFERDYDLEKMIFARVANFWDRHIVGDLAPMPINNRDLATLWAADNGQAITASDDIAEKIDALKGIKRALKRMGDEKAALELEIKCFMGEFAEVVTDEHGKPLATWKSAKPSTVLNQQKLKQDQPELWNHYAEQRDGSRRFLIK